VHNFFIFTQLFYIKNAENIYMFQSLMDHHQGVSTSIAYTFSLMFLYW
jgi:hypothetical protein